MTLREKALNGVKWTTLSTVYVAILQLVLLMIVARYLSTNELGLLAIIRLVIGFTQIFSDMGVSDAIIHKQDVSQSQLSTLYWFNIIVSVVIYMVIIVLAPYIADFYNDNSLTEFIIIATFSIVIQSFGKQFQVLFDKKLSFNFLAKIRVFSSSITFVITIYLIIAGYGIYSLIITMLLGSFIISGLFIFYGIRVHKPTLTFNILEAKYFIHFGLYQIGSRMIGYFNSQMDVIIIGKLLGNEALGIYSVIRQIVESPAKIINPIITKVSFPTMSKIQNDQIRLKNMYLKTINYISSITFPIYAAIFILSSEIIELFLGSKWESSVPILQILAIYFLFRSIGNPIGSLVLAKGKPQYEMFWNIGLTFYRPIVLFISVQWGLIGVSFGMLFLSTSLMIPNWFFLVNKLCGATFKEYFLEIFRSLLIVILVSSACILAGMPFTSIWIVIFLTLSLGLLGTVLLNIKFNNEFIQTIKQIIK